jgi:predicted nucleotide-binding protein (sugar kinase/HSP70/actin superfamily)
MPALPTLSELTIPGLSVRGGVATARRATRGAPLPNEGPGDRVSYIPLMGDHSHALAAAMRHFGLAAEVLPPTDDQSLALGLDACGGRECLPAFLALGDVLRKARDPAFDPARSAFFFPGSCGPCRFGQYTSLLRDLLDERGLDEVRLFSPSAANAFLGFGNRPRPLRMLTWQGLVAIDLLDRLRLETRPYAARPELVEAVYRAGLADALAAVEAGGGRRLVRALRQAVARFMAVPRDATELRPLVGIVGEIYVRWSEYSNRGLVRQVEELGGEVLLASMGEFVHFSTYRMRAVARASGDWRSLLASVLTDVWQTRAERRLARVVEPALRRPDESSSRDVARAVEPFYDATLGTEAVLSMGRAVDYGRMGAHGILNVLPFSCMPGLVVGGMASRIRRELEQIPWLDIPYDAQKETNIRTRLEAFMYQVHQFRRRTGRDALRRHRRWLPA